VAAPGLNECGGKWGAKECFGGKIVFAVSAVFSH